MAQTAAPQPDMSQPTRVFQIPPTYTWVASIVMLVLSLVVPVIVLLAGGNRSTLFSVIVVIITAILVVIGIVIYVSLVSARLAVSAGGISYFSSGVTISGAGVCALALLIAPNKNKTLPLIMAKGFLI